jgi:hypothetical protein
VRAASCHRKGVPSDQGYVNYLYWAGRLPFATHEIRGEGIVNTVGAMMGKNHGGSIGPLRSWFRIIDEQGFVMDNDNVTRSVRSSAVAGDDAIRSMRRIKHMTTYTITQATLLIILHYTINTIPIII